jgi:hypothetical protein
MKNDNSSQRSIEDMVNRIEMIKIERIRKAVTDGTYSVTAEKIATKLVNNMLQLSSSGRLKNENKVSHLEAEAHAGSTRLVS